jgi:hypothetical protein
VKHSERLLLGDAAGTAFASRTFEKVRLAGAVGANCGQETEYLAINLSVSYAKYAANIFVSEPTYAVDLGTEGLSNSLIFVACEAFNDHLSSICSSREQHEPGVATT